MSLRCCSPRNIGSFGSGFDSVGSGGVDLPEVKAVIGANSHLSRGTLKLFESNISFNFPRGYVGVVLDKDRLSEYYSFNDGYSVHPPLDVDRMWMSPRL